MQHTNNIKAQYFMDDPREGERLERKANPEKFLEKYLKKHLDNLSSGTILEAGCGSGALINAVGRNYHEDSILGIDISTGRVEQANAKISDLSNAKAVTADIYNLPFPDNHFDFIYSRFLYEYLKEPIAATKELCRVCKPGGRLLLQDLDNQLTFYPAVLPELDNILQELKHHTGFDPDAGRKLFSYGNEAGFSFLNAESELYHKVFGKIDDFNLDLWNLKLDIAAKNLKHIFGDKIEVLKSEILKLLKDDSTIMFSHLFTVTFAKP